MKQVTSPNAFKTKSKLAIHKTVPPDSIELTFHR